MAIPLNYCAGRDDCFDDWEHNFGFHSRHAGGAHFLSSDGSVHFFSENINMRTYRALGTLSSGEVMDGSQFGN